MILSDKDSLIRINPTFAKAKKIPVVFIGRIIKQTEKAVYLVGQGTLKMKAKGICFICGRELTHPVSMKLGIGPVCGGHFWDWDLVGGYKNANEEKLAEIIQAIKFETWLPKSVIKEFDETDQVVQTTVKPKKEVKKTAKKDGMFIRIQFPFDYETLAGVKSLSNRSYQKANRTWLADYTHENIQKLDNMGFKLDAYLLQSLIMQDKKEPLDLKHLKTILRPFQKEGVEFLHRRNGRALIGDEMGLGKTIQAVSYIETCPDIETAIIICPASLKLNWAQEIKMWMTDYNLTIISGRPKNKAGKLSIKAGLKQLEPMQTVHNKNTKKHLYIINYDILGNKTKVPTGKKKKVEVLKTGWVDFLTSINPDIVVTDECHLYKETKAQRTQGVKKLAKVTDKFLALSGTPIVNKPIEFFNALNFVDPRMFPSWWKYSQRYCGAKHNGFGWDFTGASNTEELHQIIQALMIRRLKKDVLKELPPKVRSVIPMELTNANEYKKAEKEFTELANSKNVPAALALTKIEALKQLATAGKMKGAIEWVENYIDNNGKLVIFSTHTKVLDLLQEHFGQICVRIDGSTPVNSRQTIVNNFQNDNNVRIFLGNMKAAGVGLTLTAASSVCFFELGWTPGDHDQAEDRVHRIGQEAESINAYYLIADGTIENEIMSLLDGKRKVLAQVLNGEEAEETSLLNELLQSIKDKGAV